MKRNICLLLAVLMVLLCFVPQVSAAEAAETGSCGENARYTLYTDGRLVITGTGAIDEAFFQGWDHLTAVEICEGITAIGDFAFEECSGIASLTLPDTLKSIGTGAFHGDASLSGELVIPDSVTTLNGGADPREAALGAFGKTSFSSIVIGKGVTAIPYGLASGCESLRSVTLHDDIDYISSYAFSFCPLLTYIEIPTAVTEIGPMAFVNDVSLTTVIFKGSAPQMDTAFHCASFNAAGFYPADDESWADTDNICAVSNLEKLVPYTTDSQGRLLPVAPGAEEAQADLDILRDTRHPNGSAYPDSYYYIINGDFLTGYGSEAFAFQVSDALCGYLPIGQKETVDFDTLNVGDILYMDGESCTVTAISSDSVTVAGVDADEAVYYDRTLTRAQVETADAVRARIGVSPYAGLTDPALDYELTDLPTTLPGEKQVYDTIVSMREAFPEGMPYSSKNHFYSKTESPVWYVGDMPVTMSFNSHGCSAFGLMISDICFGNLPAYYLKAGDWGYDDLKVGDQVMGYNHQVTILEIYEDYVVVVEGNYDGMIHWGRTLTREELLVNYDLYTRYPTGRHFTDVAEKDFYYEPVIWATRRDITTGATETTFNPGGECLRAQVVTFLWRAAGQPEPTTTANPFVDVKETDFYYKAVLWAVENGITNGLDDTHFGPFSSCNRAQVVTFLYRAMESPAVTTTDCPFTDVENGQWYEPAVLWAVENGITNGMSADSFGVNTVCNRAQVVTFLYRTYVN